MWVAQTFVFDVVTSATEGLHVKYPEVSGEQIQQLIVAKKRLAE
jgi:hypothetical protein